MVRTVAVDFAMRQLRRQDNYSAASRSEIESVWRDGLNVASLSFVIAKHYTRVNADQALLTGLLHGLGRLYIVMRAEEMSVVPDSDIRAVADVWQASIGKAILETWGLPEGLQHAVEHQDDLDTEPESAGDGTITLTGILVAAKVLNSNPSGASDVPALSWLNIMNELDAAAVLDQHAEEIQAIRASLGD